LASTRVRENFTPTHMMNFHKLNNSILVDECFHFQTALKMIKPPARRTKGQGKQLPSQVQSPL
jgi:hypothetical protein